MELVSPALNAEGGFLQISGLREVWVGKRRGCSRWEVLGSNNNAEDSEQTGTKKMGGWKERKGTTERDGPRERLPISGRTGSLVYISSFVSHPPPPPPVCLKTCVHATDCDPSPRASFCPSAACWCTRSGVSRSERHYGVEEHSNLSDPKEIARLWRAPQHIKRIVLISNAGRLLLLIFSHPYPLTAFGASSVCIPTWLCE